VTVSSVSSIDSTNATDPGAMAKQTRADFQAIATALQSGDVASAQQAFAQLQKDNPRLAQTLNSAPSSSDSPRIADLKSLANALKSGDVSGAQQAFAKLQQDTRAVAGHHHHHHHAGADASVATSTPAASDVADANGDQNGSTASGSILNVSA
jgi:hypothetical protein